MIVAAIAGVNDRVVVTDNARDFADIELINPVRGAG
jgi:predicted nucleic acid-binding protein